MSNVLKIYDFQIKHKTQGVNVTFHTLAMDHSGLKPNNIEPELTENIQRQLVFDNFLLKMNSDLNNEVLKNEHQKKIIKKSRQYLGNDYIVTDLHKDYNNKVIYGLLHGGRITSDSVLEKKSNDSNGDEIFEYNNLDGDRIYDNFFFLLHVSFRTNIAKLFILTRKGNVIIDPIFKSYLKTNLFNAPNFQRTLVTNYVSNEYQQMVLNRSIVNTVYISKSDRIVAAEGGTEYEVEIKLKPVNNNPFAVVTNDLVDVLRRSKVVINENTSEDEDSEIKFSIKDPVSNTSKMISFGNEDNFIPKLALDDEDILTNDTIDVAKMKAICLAYINYDTINV